MKFIMYEIGGHRPEIRPAPVERPWMDQTPDSYAYRCLPLNIGNACGWEVLCPAGFEAVWDGGASIESLKVRALDGEYGVPISHFGSGILTFHVSALFRTEPGISLWVSGPPNQPKDGIFALSGVIETDWSPYPFTMNWRMTRPGHTVRFEKGEPFCFFFPLNLDLAEQAEPEIRPMTDDPELTELYRSWSEGRGNFNKDLKVSGSEAQAAKWQKGYFRGSRPDGSQGSDKHRTKIRMKPFKRVK